MNNKTQNIKIENMVVMNLEGAIRGMRNPLRSWDKSDSGNSISMLYSAYRRPVFEIGNKDLDLAQKLVKSGSDHRKFLRQIFVSMDITAPRYWWTEFDTYKVGTVANSESTMHTIQKREFKREDFANFVGNPDCPEDKPYFRELKEKRAEVQDYILDFLNDRRLTYLKLLEAKLYKLAKCEWRTMIQFLPQSYLQMRTVTLDYETLLKIYWARKEHKLIEWHDFCESLLKLPYFYELCIKPFEEE